MEGSEPDTTDTSADTSADTTTAENTADNTADNSPDLDESASIDAGPSESDNQLVADDNTQMSTEDGGQPLNSPAPGQQQKVSEEDEEVDGVT